MSSSIADMPFELTVRGLLADQAGTWSPGEVSIAGGRIVRVATGADAATAAPGGTTIDMGGSYLLPGVVDSHVHCLSHGGEGVRAATSAAAAGGVTTIVEMPFDAAGPINSPDRLRAKQELVAAEAVVDVALLGTVHPDGGWRVAEQLADGGVVGFKVSLFDTDPVRFPRINDAELVDVMRTVQATGGTLCVHAENNEIVKRLLADASAGDPADPQAHTRTRPPVSETVGVLTALEIAATTGVALHLCHLSTPRAVGLVGWYRDQGIDVTLETCPHYLTFTDKDLDQHRGRLKINPPLRTLADREGLWQALARRDIPIVASDHAPWPLELKDHERILDNHSGVPGVETLVAVTLGQALRRDPSMRTFNEAVRALTVQPATRFGLQDRKGTLAVGYDADLIAFTPDEAAQPAGASTIDGGALHSNAGWSPYHGFAPGGRVTLTISRGAVIWSAGAGLSAAAGRGEVLVRKVS